MNRRDLLKAAGATAAMPNLALAANNTRFDEADALIRGDIAGGKLPGYVTLVDRGEEVAVHTGGTTTLGGREPMARDSIFRIASMTKPIVAAAAMMLVEEGRLDLDAPVERWLPELADRRVLKRLDGPLDDTVPAARSITVRDLQTFTMGFGILFREGIPIQDEIEALKLVNAAPYPQTPWGPDEWMKRFATLPLMRQPGEAWMYNTSALVMGVLVARAAGQPLEVFLHERFFAPLGMKDTGFFVPPAQIDRLVGGGYMTSQQTGRFEQWGDGQPSQWSAPPPFPSGAGGLVSTADDYLAFARMLQGGGEYRGRRYLRAQTVAEMTRDQLTPSQKDPSVFFPGFFDTHGWGYGMSVITAPDDIARRPGRYGWNGGYGTDWFNDPGTGTINIVLTQSTDFLFSPDLRVYERAVIEAAARS